MIKTEVFPSNSPFSMFTFAFSFNHGRLFPVHGETSDLYFMLR